MFKQKKRCVVLVSLFAMAVISPAAQPNILFISVDDLNDWVGCLGGHPQTRTPNIDRLAARGVLFSNAHCQSPVCNPSRASLMTSSLPSTTGLYFLAPEYMPDLPAMASLRPMPAVFAEQGYDVRAAGKLFHNKANRAIFGAAGKYAGNFGGFGPLPGQENRINYHTGTPLWDWGAYPDTHEKMPDWKIADWAERQLNQDFEKPFFLSVGFLRPHVPLYVPEEWFGLHPLETIQLPEMPGNDMDDISAYAKNLTTLEHISPTCQWMAANGQEKKAVQAYLASISFVDHCVGRVLDALEKRSDADNTIIVLASDHGFHMGEKNHWAKRTLWEDGTRVPLIICGPDIEPGVSTKPVGLIDLFPTLLDLTEQQPIAAHEGNSLKPLLENPAQDWPHVALTFFGQGNTSVRSEHFRYIHYNDGSEEFYDHRKDPNEWTSLSGNPEWANEIARHRKQVPAVSCAVIPGASTGHKAYAAAENLK